MRRGWLRPKACALSESQGGLLSVHVVSDGLGEGSVGRGSGACVRCAREPGSGTARGACLLVGSDESVSVRGDGGCLGMSCAMVSE